MVMYGWESWTVKKVECWRIDAFELWCWRRLLRVPWTARRSNQSILKETSLDVHWKNWCWGWNSNTLATSCEELTHWGQEEKGTTEDEMVGWHHQLNACEFGWTPGVGDGQGGLACCDSWGHKESDMTERLNWTEHSLEQWFSTFNVQRNYLKILLKGKYWFSRLRWNLRLCICNKPPDDILLLE